MTSRRPAHLRSTTITSSKTGQSVAFTETFRLLVPIAAPPPSAEDARAQRTAPRKLGAPNTGRRYTVIGSSTSGPSCGHASAAGSAGSVTTGRAAAAASGGVSSRDSDTHDRDTFRSAIGPGQRLRATCSDAGGSESESSTAASASPASGDGGKIASAYGFDDGDGDTGCGTPGGVEKRAVEDAVSASGLGAAEELPELEREGEAVWDCDAELCGEPVDVIESVRLAVTVTLAERDDDAVPVGLHVAVSLGACVGVIVVLGLPDADVLDEGVALGLRVAVPLDVDDTLGLWVAVPLGVDDTLGLWVAVPLNVDDTLGLWVTELLRNCEAVRLWVALPLRVCVSVGLWVAVPLGTCDALGLCVRVPLEVSVRTWLPVAVALGVCVRVGLFVAVTLAVADSVGVKEGV